MTDAPRLVMLVGSPRSGTTWLQTLLGAHPEIATPQETDLFRVYLQPLVDAWERQLHGATVEGERRRRKGLPLVLTEAEFDDAAGALVRRTLHAVRDLKPGASVVVEKSPSHSMCVATILRFVPAAPFVHIVRDGRDAAASMVAASGDWGQKWAPGSIARAAQVWRDHLLGAREAVDAPGGYFEVRYEDLLGDGGAALLQQAFSTCGVEVSADAAAAYVDEHSFERMKAGGQVSGSILLGGEAGGTQAAQQEPEGFFRKGTVGGWRDEWSVADRQAFARVAGDLLVQLGYERDDSWVGGRVQPSLVTRAAHRAANDSARGLRALADRIEQLPLRKR
jgi:hypothetical protein